LLRRRRRKKTPTTTSSTNAASKAIATGPDHDTDIGKIDDEMEARWVLVGSAAALALEVLLVLPSLGKVMLAEACGVGEELNCVPALSPVNALAAPYSVLRVRTAFRKTTSWTSGHIRELLDVFADSPALAAAPNRSQVPHRGSGSASHVWKLGWLASSAVVSKWIAVHKIKPCALDLPSPSDRGASQRTDAEELAAEHVPNNQVQRFDLSLEVVSRARDHHCANLRSRRLRGLWLRLKLYNRRITGACSIQESGPHQLYSCRA